MRRLALAAILAAVPASSFAAPVTLEFTGTIFLYEVDGADLTSTLSHLNASGTITWDLAIGPAPTFATDGATFYQYNQESGPSPYIEFVQSSVQWANGTFTSAAVPPPVPSGANATGDEFVLANWVDGTTDLLVIGDLYQWDAADGSYGINGLGLNTVANFLDDASGFPNGTELPDFATAFTIIGMFDLIENALGQRTGFAAGILVDSARLRPVPEPSTLVLLGVGLGAAALVRRRKLGAKGAKA